MLLLLVSHANAKHRLERKLRVSDCRAHNASYWYSLSFIHSFTFTFGPESKLPQPEARSRRIATRKPPLRGSTFYRYLCYKARSYDDIWIETHVHVHVHTHTQLINGWWQSMDGGNTLASFHIPTPTVIIWIH